MSVKSYSSSGSDVSNEDLLDFLCDEEDFKSDASSKRSSPGIDKIQLLYDRHSAVLTGLTYEEFNSTCKIIQSHEIVPGQPQFLRRGSIPGLHRSVILNPDGNCLLLLNTKNDIHDCGGWKKFSIAILVNKETCEGQLLARLTPLKDEQERRAAGIRREIHNTRAVATRIPATSGIIYDGMHLCKTGKLVPFFLQRYFPSGSLDKVVSTLPLALRFKLVVQLLDILTHLHSQGMIHRDLKLQNIFIDENFNPYLADFGAILCNHQTDLLKVPAGTPDYLAPEAWSVEQVDEGLLQEANPEAYQVIKSRPDDHRRYSQEFQERGGTEKLDIYSMGVMCRRIISMGSARPLSYPESCLIDLFREMRSLNPADRPTAAQTLARAKQILGRL
jgi:serine/threonine protein kinase